jgi:hypothetical protein
MKNRIVCTDQCAPSTTMALNAASILNAVKDLY